MEQERLKAEKERQRVELEEQLNQEWDKLMAELAEKEERLAKERALHQELEAAIRKNLEESAKAEQNEAALKEQ